MVQAETTGSRLRQAREARGLKQDAVAEAAGVHEKTVSKWENDKQNPGANQLARVAPLLGVSVDWLLEPAYDEISKGVPATVPDPIERESLENPLPRVLRTHRVRVWLSGFRHELTKAGASDPQIAEAMNLLTAPQVFTYYRGGAPGEVSESEAIVGMEAIAKFIRQRLRKRGLRFPAASNEEPSSEP